ncbi:hypothetical protein ACFLXL_02425 [Chloroflexota bacterium]
MTDKKHYVFSARTTQAGLITLNDLNRSALMLPRAEEPKPATESGRGEVVYIMLTLEAEKDTADTKKPKAKKVRAEVKLKTKKFKDKTASVEAAS